MTSRVVTGTLYYADGVTVWPSAPVVITPQFPGQYEVGGVTNASGVFSITVPLPDTGNGTYVARFPGDVASLFTMGASSSAYDISALIATIEATSPLSQAQALTDGATIAWNTSLGRFATVTLAGNRTMAAPTGLVAGALYRIKITQDGTGSRTITWNAIFKWAGGTAPTLSTAAAKVDLLEFTSDGTNLYGRALLDVR
jgi:hypothetical protein